jgi:hypothetical protein
MRRLPRIGCAAQAVGILLVLTAATDGLLAEGFERKELSLRLPAALTRFAPYADVAGVGGASAGSKWSSSVNPAAVAWEPIKSPLHLSLTPQYSAVCFQEDLTLQVAAEALTWQTPGYGAFQPALAQIRSSEGTTRQGLDFNFDMDLVQLQWAKRASDDWAVGLNFNFAKARLDYDLGPIPISDSNSETYGWRFGTLHRVVDKLLAGVVFDYAFTPTRTTLHDFMGLGIGDVRIRDTGHQYVLRPGVSYEYKKDSAVYADYVFGVFRDDTGSLRVHRFMVGVDHNIIKGLFFRTGMTLDVRGNASWACGLGIYPTDWLAIDIAYQNNMFPELETEFGRSQTFTISVSLSL